jgi:hypothetical protein
MKFFEDVCSEARFLKTKSGLGWHILKLILGMKNSYFKLYSALEASHIRIRPTAYRFLAPVDTAYLFLRIHSSFEWDYITIFYLTHFSKAQFFKLQV